MQAQANPTFTLDEDDDDLQIVQESINTRPRPPVVDDDLEIVDEHIAPARTTRVDLLDDDIAVVSETRAHASFHPSEILATALPLACAACDTPLPDDKPGFKLKLSRCRHSLCPACVIKSISSAANNALNLNPAPMCVAPRCRAPYSDTDVQNALAHPEIDEHFRPAFDDFVAWADIPDVDDDPDAIFGPNTIVFPDLDPSVDAQISPDDEHFADDTEAAYGLLWVWDKDYVHPDTTAVGQWLCAACGAYNDNPNANVQPHNGNPDDEAMPDDIPDYPLRPHCARARAFAVRECIARLTKVAEDAEKPATTSARGGRGRRGRGRGRGRAKRTRATKATTTTKRRRTTSTGFAKGTGFAGRQGAEWKGASSKMLENTRKIDLHTAHWLARIRCYLLWQSDAHDAWPGYMRTLLRESQLAEHLAKILINESIMDVGERVPVYVAALRVVAALNDSPSLRVLVAEKLENGRSLAMLIDSLSKQAALLSNGAAKDQTIITEETKQLVRQIRKAVRGVHRHKMLGDNPSASRFDLRLTGDAPKIDLPQSNVEHGEEAQDGKKEKVSEERQKKYCEVMKELQFATVPALAKASAFRSEANKGAAAARRSSMRRVVSEVSSLLSSLPVSWSSTICVRVDEDRYDFLRACVFGPEDTPYENGAFLFDIFLPPEYPESPPKFKLLTTGNGRVRFNPNLYANGKVCLSLLGTWTGPSWTAASTLLQVLVSIQSLIFVAEPFFNEPGFERWCGTEKGKKNSESYNVNVRQNTVRWAVLDALKNPFNEFRTVIQAHFRLKRGVVEAVMRDWFKKPQQQPNGVASASPAAGSSAAGPSAAAALDQMTSAITEMGNLMNSLTASSSNPLPQLPPPNVPPQQFLGSAMLNTMSSLMVAGVPVMDHGPSGVKNIDKVVADVIQELDKLENHSSDPGVDTHQTPAVDDEPIAIL